MSNPNVKPRFKKNDPETKRIAAKGGRNKKGYKSLKSIMKEIFASGEIDPREYVKAQMIEAMTNPSMAKLHWEYHDGKVKDEVEVTQTIKEINVNFIEPKRGNKRTKKT